jgi:hypothetical protein
MLHCAIPYMIIMPYHQHAHVPVQGTPPVLEKKFIFAAHKSGVKCIAGAGPFVASGGSDDTIHLYDVEVQISD